MPRKPQSQIQLAIDYKTTFGTENGKRVLFDLMGACHMTSTSHVAGNPTETAYREGERNIMLRILSILERDVSKLREMITERENEA